MIDDELFAALAQAMAKQIDEEILGPPKPPKTMDEFWASRDPEFLRFLMTDITKAPFVLPADQTKPLVDQSAPVGTFWCKHNPDSSMSMIYTDKDGVDHVDHIISADGVVKGGGSEGEDVPIKAGDDIVIGDINWADHTITVDHNKPCSFGVESSKGAAPPSGTFTDASSFHIKSASAIHLVLGEGQTREDVIKNLFSDVKSGHQFWLNSPCTWHLGNYTKTTFPRTDWPCECSNKDCYMVTWEDNTKQPTSEDGTHICTCDYEKVTRIIGCQCGGV